MKIRHQRIGAMAQTAVSGGGFQKQEKDNHVLSSGLNGQWSVGQSTFKDVSTTRMTSNPSLPNYHFGDQVNSGYAPPGNSRLEAREVLKRIAFGKDAKKDKKAVLRF